jgi:hypothetical protein
MAKYRVYFEMTNSGSIIIEAGSEEEADSKFCDMDNGDIMLRADMECAAEMEFESQYAEEES